MRAYRVRRSTYRERERLRQRRRRSPEAKAVSAAVGVVTEAGQSSQELATVYVVTGPAEEVRLHVVTATGRAMTIRAEAAYEAGSGEGTWATRGGAQGRVVTEAG